MAPRGLSRKLILATLGDGKHRSHRRIVEATGLSDLGEGVSPN